MLVLTCDKKIEIAVAGEHEMHASAALPIAVGDALTVKIVEDLQQQRQDVLAASEREMASTSLAKSIFVMLPAPWPCAARPRQ